MEQLASVLATRSQMKLLSVLHLASNRLNDEALALLSKGIAMQAACGLTDLDLSHNCFGREGARGIALPNQRATYLVQSC